MITFATVIGLAAAVCTTTANLPQLKKAWTTGQTDDLSLKTLLLFGCGLALWVVYGVLQKDVVIILANGISLALLAAILSLKLLQTRLNRTLNRLDRQTCLSRAWRPRRSRR
jgi:MtN3 and saliva related transmembrane protein